MFNRLHNQPHIVRQASPASCCRWVTKVEQPSITGYGQLHLHSLRSRWKAQSVLSSLWLLRRGEGPRPPTVAVSSWPRRAWPGAGGTFVRQTGFGTSRWSSLLWNSPQLMEWDTTVTTWSSKAALNSPAVLPCVTHGSLGHQLLLQPVQDFNLCCCEMLYFSRG